MIGQTIAHYRIEAELGHGGMGVVYRARDTRLGRSVALKFLPLLAEADPSARARLLEEARTASALNHPHICTIHEVGEAEGRSFIAMEYVEGKPLSTLVRPDGLPADAVVRYGLQIAAALAHAHAHGVVHRDLKSRNVIVTPDGRAKVLDFGLAARSREVLDEATRSALALPQGATGSGTVSGTLHYLAPELLRGQPADARSDIWAFGVLLYEMAAGRLPFAGQTSFEISSAILRESPPPLPAHLPASLRGIVQHCLAKEPGERYQQAAEMRAALEAVATDSAGAAVVAASPVAARLAKAAWVRRTGLLLAGILVTFALLTWVTAGWWRGKPASAPAEESISMLAILPLRTLGGPASEDFLGAGIAETVTTKVSQIGGITVRPPGAVQKYAAPGVDALEAARQLQVDAVLEGSVQRSAERLRVNLNLLRARDGASLWSESFNVPRADIFDVQDQIAQKVVAGLRLKLTPSEQQLLTKRFTANPEAYEFYVKGMQSFSRRGLTTASRVVLEDSIAAFRRAIELDPRYALAHAQLAYCYVWMALFTDPGPQWLVPAREEIRRTETLDPALPELYIVRHELLWSAFEGFRVADSARELQRAQQLNPSIGHEQLAVVFAHMGLEEPALAQVRRALEIDPTSELNQSRYVEVYDLLMRPDEAIATNVRFGNLPGPAFYLRKSYLWKKEFNRAGQEIFRQLQRNREDPFTLSNQALLDALNGKFSKSESILPGIVQKSQGSRAFHHVAYNIASIYALQGKTPQAVEWLKKTVDYGMPNYTLFSRDPHFDPIRREPGFIRFMNELKPKWDAYAREFGS